MDKIIKITLGIFIVLLVAFVACAGYSWYVENTYRSSLFSTYFYTCTITTDSPLSNVTMFVPVPADRSGNSPVIGEFSAHTIGGVPDTWKTELYDTGKATLVKITTPALVPPEGTTTAHPYSVTLYTNVSSKNPIDTKNPVENSPVFRPVLDLTPAAAGDSYVTTVYADYQAAPGAVVTIDSSLIARNDWKVFGPASNEYRAEIHVRMSGSQKGWTPVTGNLQAGIGAYDAPVLHK